MFSFDRFTRVATAAVGALVLSTLSVAAAVGPARVAETSPVVYAKSQLDQTIQSGADANA
jgi:hypothetical protein